MEMKKKEKKQQAEFTREELQNILAGVKKFTEEELSMVFGGFGDDREEYTLDEAEINKDIFGTKLQ